MQSIEIISLFFSAIYLFFFIIIASGFFFSLKLKRKSTSPVKSFSLIIPVKNEAKNLPFLSESLMNQKPCNGEVIFVDDHSTDSSLKLMQKFSHPHFVIRIIQLSDHEFGKKTAIEKGVQLALHELIITTDADCVFTKNWLYTHASYGCEGNYILAGSVDILPANDIKNKIFQLEQLGIQIITSGLSYWKKPIAISGANLSYPKNVFTNLNPYQSNKDILSGDDIFLMQSAVKNNIQIISDQSNDLKVYTRSGTMKEYFSQHIRWFKKRSSFHDWVTVCTGLGIVISALLFLFQAGYQLILFKVNDSFVISMGIKTVVDFLLLFLILQQRNRLILLSFFIPAFLFNTLVTAILPLTGWFIPVTWKGRKI